MAQSGNGAGRMTIEELAEQLARVEARLASMETGQGPEATGTEDHLVSRRGVFKALGVAAAGGVGLAIGSGLLSAGPAAAANDNPVLLGEVNTATAPTEVKNTDTTTGAGLKAISTAGNGVWGVANTQSGINTGVLAGVAGDSTESFGVMGLSAKNWGVYGVTGADSSNNTGFAAGVVGGSSAGIGVMGLSDTNCGVYAASGAESGINTGLYAGVVGDSSSGLGVMGLSADSDGVYGVAGGQSGIGTPYTAGVVGDTNASAGIGLIGASVDLSGIYGIAAATSGLAGPVAGVFGDSNAQAGITGLSSTGNGVFGAAAGRSGTHYGVQSAVTGDTTDGIGVSGISLNYSGAAFTTLANGNDGVFANDASETGGYGIYGTSQNGGVGVWGESDTAGGVGVSAVSASGTALSVDGVASFSRSGLATVAGTASTPETAVTVTGVTLTSSSVILATPQGKVAGVAVEGVVKDVSKGSFTINLTGAVTVSLRIGWLIVDVPAAATAGPARAATPQIVRGDGAPKARSMGG